MKETIYSRVRRIIRSSIRQWIEAIEDVAPQESMEKAVGEVQDVIETVRSELGKTLADKYLASKALSEAQEQHYTFISQIEAALREGQEDAAKFAISKQLDIEDQIASLKSRLISFEEKEAELENFIAALHLKKQEMQAELSRLRQYGRNMTGEEPAYALQSKISRAESLFSRGMEEQTGLPGILSDTKDSASLAELEKLSRETRIQERLASCRAQVAGRR